MLKLPTNQKSFRINNEQKVVLMHANAKKCNFLCKKDENIKKIGEFLAKIYFYGTGSYPLPPHGWQRKMRFIANHKPLNSPCLRKASNAYCEQVGVYRHDGGNIGDMQIW